MLATHNRAARLARLLDGLRSQTLDDWEVVIVDDGSSDATREVLERAEGLPLTVIHLPESRGPSVARNEGWRAARGELIAFTDDDCVPTPRWAEAGLEAWEAAGRGDAVIQGRVDIEPSEMHHYNPLAHTLEVHELGAGFETANIFYPRALLERVGGFDAEAFRGPGGEDTDLAWRAIKAGAEAIFAPEALVHHGVLRAGAIKRLRVAARWSESIRVFERHPEIREHLVARVFWRYNHWLLFRFVVAWLLPRRLWPLRLWLASPYVVYLSDRRTGPLLAPYLLALDLVEVVAVVRGAIRYRTFVL